MSALRIPDGSAYSSIACLLRLSLLHELPGTAMTAAVPHHDDDRGDPEPES